jgi:hypothetical protein
MGLGGGMSRRSDTANPRVLGDEMDGQGNVISEKCPWLNLKQRVIDRAE